MAMIAPPTANPTLIFAGRANCSTAIAARAEAVLPTTADHGWASGELGMANSRNALAPSGAINRKLAMRSEDHTSELQSLMRISYAVFCLKKKKKEKENEITDNKH